MLAILMFVASNSHCMKKHIYSGVSRNLRMPDKIVKLRDAGLIEGVTVGAVTRYVLTERGRSVAEMLAEVARHMSDASGQVRASRFGGAKTASVPSSVMDLTGSSHTAEGPSDPTHLQGSEGDALR